MGIFDVIKAGAEKLREVTRQRMMEEVADFLHSAVGGQKNLDILIDARMSFYEAAPVIFRSREGAAWLKEKRIIIDIGESADIQTQLITKIGESSFGSYLMSIEIDSAIDGFGVIIEDAGFEVPEWYLRMCMEDFTKALRS